MRRSCARLVRRLGWDRHPVRRRVDRVQTILTAVLLVVLLLVTPAVAFLVGAHAYTSGLNAERRDRASFRQVTATVLQVREISGDGSGHFLHEEAVLQWKDRTGGLRTGVAILVSQVRVHDRLTQWTDGDGTLSGRPHTRQQTLTRT